MSKGVFSNSVGRKFIMGLTGFFLITFITIHLLVNSFSLISADLFNQGSHFMATNPLIQVMQYALAAGFIIHIFMGIKLTLQNNKARGAHKYAMNKPNENSSLSSRSMIYSGILVLVFILLHMKDFFYNVKFGNIEHVGIESHGITTMVQNDFSLMAATFGSPIYTLIYVVAFLALGLHLNHGFQSAFQTMGLNHSKYNPAIKGAGVAYSALIAIGFSAVAIFHFINS